MGFCKRPRPVHKIVRFDDWSGGETIDYKKETRFPPSTRNSESVDEKRKNWDTRFMLVIPQTSLEYAKD
jgi:hypothetical protein